MKFKKYFALMCLLFGTACSGNNGSNVETEQTGTDDSTSAQETQDTAAIESEKSETTTTAAVEIDDGTMKALIKPETTYQTMIGFGAGYTWYSDWALKKPENKEAIADLLFKDAKMTILRFKNEYKYYSDTVADDCRETQFYNMAQERAEEYGEDVTVLMSCWSAPEYLKSNDVTAGHGTLKKNENGEYMYGEYGEWWAESVEAYTNAGVKIDYVSIQNECDFEADWDGMELAMFETEYQAAYSQAYLSVYDSMQERLTGNTPLMIGPETMSCDTSTLKMYMKDILEKNPDSVAGIAHHLYVGGNSGESDSGSSNVPDSFNINFRNNSTEFSDKYSIWQTEFFRGTPLQTAALISNSLVNGNLNAYIFWGGIWEGGDLSKARNDVINVDYSGDYTYGSTYWVMRHFSEFIRPGYIRVQVNFPYNGGFKVSAFKSPDESKYAVVFVNPTEEDIEISMPIEGYTVTDSTIYQTILEEDAYDTGDYYSNIGKLNENNKLTLKAKSIITLDITGYNN